MSFVPRQGKDGDDAIASWKPMLIFKPSTSLPKCGAQFSRDLELISAEGARRDDSALCVVGGWTLGTLCGLGLPGSLWARWPMAGAPARVPRCCWEQLYPTIRVRKLRGCPLVPRVPRQHSLRPPLHSAGSEVGDVAGEDIRAPECQGVGKWFMEQTFSGRFSPSSQRNRSTGRCVHSAAPGCPAYRRLSIKAL